MSKKPSIQFYPGDWRKDPGVSRLSLAAKGLWWEMLLQMNEAPRRGYLDVTHDQLARSVGSTAREVKKLLGEMKAAETYSEVDGCIVNRRMLREAGISVTRSEVGKRGAELRWQTDGKSVANDSSLVTHLPRPRAGAAEAENEIEVENENREEVQGEGVGGFSSESIDQVCRWMYEFMSEEWPYPDLLVGEQVLLASNGVSLDRLGQFFRQLRAQGKKPAKSWVWFVGIVRQHFGRPNHGDKAAV